MEERTIRGVLEYNEKNYPFIIENRILTIVQHFQQYYADFQETVELGTLFGLTDTNRRIIMLNCCILSPSTVAIGGAIQISLYGYILQWENDDGFDRIDFCSPALRAFYPTYKEWGANRTDTAITLPPVEQNVTRVSVSIAGEELHCSLRFSRFFNYKPEEQYPLTIYPIFSIVFSQKKKAIELGQYYLYIFNFLCLMNFRANVPFDDIILYKLNSENVFDQIGKAVIFQHPYIDYIPDIRKSITFDDLGVDAFSKLFQDLSEQSLQKTYNPFFLPESKHEIATVDIARWLVAAISFEGEFDRKYKNYQAEKHPEFFEVKNMLLSTIRNAKENATGKKKKYCERFDHLIKQFDTTIEHKFRICEDIFKVEIQSMCKKYCSWAKIDETTDFAEKYAETRNNTAHGVIRKITPEDTITFQLLRCFIYLLILERAGVPKEKRTHIIKKLF